MFERSGVPVLVELAFAFYAGYHGPDFHWDTCPIIILNLIQKAKRALGWS